MPDGAASIENVPYDEVDSAEYEGHWWLPATPEDRVSGYLTISAAGKAKLRLIGGFSSQHAAMHHGMVSKVNGHNDFALVHGRTTKHNEVTLVDAIQTQASSRMFFDKISAQSLEPARVLFGIHLANPHDRTFTSATFMIENFHAWAGTAGEVSYPLDDDDFSYRTATVREQPESRVSIGDGLTLVVTNRLGLFSTRLSRSAAETACRTWTQLQIESSDPLEHNGFDEAIMSLADLVTFATGEPSAVTEYAITHQTPELRRRPVFEDELGIRSDEYDHTVSAAVRTQWLTTPGDDGTPPRDPHEYLFTHADLAIVECIPRWFDLRSRARRAIDMVLSLTYGKQTYLQTEVLILATAAEALHRAIAPDTLRMQPADFERMMATAMKGLDPTDREIIQNAIHNEPSYRERLIDLARVPSAPAVSTLVPDVAKWAKEVAQIRNGLAHSMASYLAKPEDLHHMVTLRQQTQLLLQLVILAELKLPEEQQKYIVRHAGR